jgi:peptidoglycan/LPS O-acetylase OafA/YrhL
VAAIPRTDVSSTRISGAKKSERIPSLDGLRAIAITFVLVAHASPTFHVHSAFGTALLFVFGNFLGVSMFFALSGFLITSLLLSEQDRTNDINVRAFYKRRASRTLPAVYFYIAVIGILSVARIIGTTPGDYVSAATFVLNYKFSADNWYLGHLWTLCLQEQLYLLWPVALLLLSRKSAVSLCVALIALTPVMRVLMYACVPVSRGHIPIMLHTRIDGMMFGCLMALKWNAPGFRRFLNVIYRWQVPVMALGFLVFLSPWLANTFKGAYLLPIGWTLDAAGVAIVLAWAVDHPHGLIGRFLNSRPATFIGAMSYSLYLWQQPFLTSLNISITGRFPFNIICCFAAAGLSYAFVERSFIQRRTSGAPKRLVVPASAPVSYAMSCAA